MGNIVNIDKAERRVVLSCLNKVYNAIKFTIKFTTQTVVNLLNCNFFANASVLVKKEVELRKIYT